LSIPFGEEVLEGSIPARFEHVVGRCPDQAAVVDGDQRLTYDELNRAANRVAHAILAAGTSGATVALVFEHGIQAIVAVFGTLKAGKICVPVDPQHPVERVRRILEHAEAELLVTNTLNAAHAQALVGSTAERLALRVLNVDQIGDDTPSGNPGLPITADTCSYIVYTSGTSGEPKGVLKTHRTVLINVKRDTDDLHITTADRIPLLSSYSLGISRAGIYDPLLNGAALYFYDVKGEGALDLIDWAARQRITHLLLVPTLFRHLVDHVRGEFSLPDLRTLTLAGESLTRHDVKLFRSSFPAHTVLINRIGMGEVGKVAAFQIDGSTEIKDGIVPVGYAVDGAEILILDEQGRELAPGQVGEIVVRSTSASPGYWRDPKLTREKFRPVPGRGTEPFCYTGDLGVMQADGCLKHLGRKDMQVKLRGYRVDVAEVELALLEHAGVRKAAVVDYQDEGGETRLAAYFVPAEGASPGTLELRGSLAEILPDYMIPSVFVSMDALPLTVTGKIDRRALPVPDVTRRGPDSPYVAPRDALEKRLVEMWEDLLGVQPVGIRDNFLDLGGHSLLAVRFAHEANRQLHRDLPMAALAGASTIERIAALLRESEAAAPRPSLVVLQAEGSLPPLYCVHPRGGHVLRYHHLIRHLGNEQPVYGLQAQGLDGRGEPHQRIEDMAAHYVREIRGVQAEGPYYLCGFSLGGKIAYEMACQLHEQGQQVALLAFLDTVTPPLPMAVVRERAGEAIEALERFVTVVRDGIRKDVRAMRRLAAREVPAYLWDRAGRVWDWQVARRVRRVFREPGPAREPGIPPENRIMQIARLADGNYDPRPYPGRVVFFRASVSKGMYVDPRDIWGDLALGGVEVIDIPGSHRSIMEEPDVRLLAEKLREAIAQARAAQQAD
jgi:amino acid adenylation domain-containing protein